MDERAALCKVRRELVRFGGVPGLPSRSQYARLVRELNDIVDDVNTVSGAAVPEIAAAFATEKRAEILAELVKSGILFRACRTCGARFEACSCVSRNPDAFYELDASVLGGLALNPTI